jgi:hypothetical protein
MKETYWSWFWCPGNTSKISIMSYQSFDAYIILSKIQKWAKLYWTYHRRDDEEEELEEDDDEEE